jgi:thiamine transport system substrate-binding protein
VNHRLPTAIALATLATAGLAACGDDEPPAVTLIAYDSFPVDPDTAIAAAFEDFTEETGIDVEVVSAGDTGTMLAKAALTAGNPEGDVLWGIDNTFLSRALDADVFEPYEAAGIDDVPEQFTALVPDHEATPVDFGDVCVNYDVGALESAGLAAPTRFADLISPDYAGQLVVENPGTSSPGLAFLLATIAAYGEDGWQDYWEALVANDVLVVDSWSQAYYEEFSYAGGDRALVVSYGSSPPYEVLFAEDPPSSAPTAVIEDTCFRQVEFAGVLRGTDRPDEAGRLVDFLLSDRFQREIAMELFVLPVNPDVELAEAFTEYAVIPDDPITIDPSLIDANRTEWTDQWTSTVSR